LAVDLEISDKVVFTGFKSNPYPYIKHAKCLVLSSRFEGFGRVIAEALAVDTPVISTDCPYGPSELLPKQNLVPVDDIDALAQLLEQAMANPSALSERAEPVDFSIALVFELGVLLAVLA
ncbi:glycosyltransferase, partial [Mycobacterium tuberculosis]|uniref:glycosyltransferase n=1 Tax=Mycobacterium tuberculosis TaxID=1773 RepID=UPI001ADFEE59|nr:glycosyltransferase [Mycobacterium tuberculosis]